MGLQITEDRLKIIEKLYGIKSKADIIDLYDMQGNATGTRVVIDIPRIQTNQYASYDKV